MKIALICNWNEPCGISTYSRFLVNELQAELLILSEKGDGSLECWTRGETLRPVIDQLNRWKPDYVIMQHDYGIFPNNRYLLELLSALRNFPSVVTMHSVYARNNSLCYDMVCRWAPNIIVHSQQCKSLLEKFRSNVYLVPHGCHKFQEAKPSKLTVFQFGFGFKYKGVHLALEAIRMLKDKFPDILYRYVCAENIHTENINREYMKELRLLSKNIEDHVEFIAGYQDDHLINKFLQESSVAIFPYVNPHDKLVFGSSGAARIAMSMGVPVIVSKHHLFDDLEGIVPRPKSEDLANTIEKIFLESEYRKELLDRNKKFVTEFSWQKTAKDYLEVYNKIRR